MSRGKRISILSLFFLITFSNSSLYSYWTRELFLYYGKIFLSCSMAGISFNTMFSLVSNGLNKKPLHFKKSLLKGIPATLTSSLIYCSVEYALNAYFLNEVLSLQIDMIKELIFEWTKISFKNENKIKTLNLQKMINAILATEDTEIIINFALIIIEPLIGETGINQLLKIKEKNKRELLRNIHLCLKKAIEEAKEKNDNDLGNIEVMRKKLETLPISEKDKKELKWQINYFEKLPPDSYEAKNIRGYLELIFSLPWGITTEDNFDIAHAKKVLDEDHYGLDRVKDRILDFVSLKNIKKDASPPILCFVGPPGVGKTSLVKSIARSLGRGYGRISLGGMKDESEIRGHRRTYIGAMPGQIVQIIKNTGSFNPVILLDEIDKISFGGFFGNVSAAMLEVLDPQQNKTFYDNYLGMPFDLSKVIFIATANNVNAISAPLRDRMEIIELSNYMLEEKINIAQNYLIKKTIKATGLEEKEITISDAVLQKIITNYTCEAGVRQLERLIHTLCSKVVRNLVERSYELIFFTPDNIESYLGPKKFMQEEPNKKDQVGICNGLVWTVYGGEIIKIEAMLIPGSGKLILTGQLGDVMKESVQAALSYARAHAKKFDIDDKIFSTHDLHIHAPAAAIPKDGPSAGITILTAMLSALTNRPINAQYAMTGELDLSGEVLPIGGLKEKLLAAKRNDIFHVIIPKKNSHHLADTQDITKNMDIILVNHVNEVLDRVLLPAIKKNSI